MNTISFGDFVKLATVIWIKGYTSIVPAMLNSGLVKRVPVTKNTGNTREFSEIDTNEYLSYKGEGDQAARGKIQQGYTKTMTKYRIAENVGITFEMRDENKYPEIISTLLAAGQKGPNSIDLDLSHRFTFGTAQSYTDRDGRTIDVSTGDTFALFYTLHTLKGSGTTYRNRLANNPQLSKGALELMEKLIITDTYNQLGEAKPGAVFDVLWTTDDPNTVNTVREYLKSTASPDAAHAGVFNNYVGKYRHVILPRVALTAAGAPDSTKSKYWGIASTAMSSLFFGEWESPHMIPPVANGNAEDVQTDDWDFRNRAGYGITCVGAAWTKFSSGDSVA